MQSAERQTEVKTIGRLNTVVFWVLFIASVASNYVLVAKVQSLKKELVSLKSGNSLTVGTFVPPIDGSDPQGGPMRIAYGDSSLPTVLYVFTPQCHWCQKNLPNLRVLASQSGTKYRLIGISLTEQDLQAYIKEQNLTFPVLTRIPDGMWALYHLGGTPSTIVVSPDARVQRVWAGAYHGEIKEEIEAYLGLRLSGW